jgi:electron transport complex protein RnfG
MKDMLRLILTLLVICLIAGVLLAFVNQRTAAPIAAAARAAKTAAIAAVLPEYDNDPGSTAYTNEVDGSAWVFYVARKNGQFAGAAFETVSSEGYGGDIRVMVGVTSKGKMQGIQILKAMETPGLGAKIAEDDFRSQFVDKDLETTTWAVKKDKGSIDQITAATISSRAVVNAIQSGLEVYKQHREEISRTGSEG